VSDREPTIGGLIAGVILGALGAAVFGVWGWFSLQIGDSPIGWVFDFGWDLFAFGQFAIAICSGLYAVFFGLGLVLALWERVRG